MSAKKEALSQFNRSEILVVARALFAERGFEGTGMDEIAATANYSKSTVYVYFSGKEDILNHLILEDMRALQGGIAQSLSQHAAFEKRYFAICESLVHLSQKDAQFFSHIFGNISVDEADFVRLPVLREIYNTGEETNRLIEQLFQDAVAAGQVRAEIDPVRAGFVYWSSIGGLISIASNKEAYFQKRFGISREEFLQYGFTLLLAAVKKGENI